MLKLLIVLIFGISVIFTVKDGDYGNFELTVTEFRQCKGPKSANCTYIHIDVASNSSVLHNVTVLKPMKLKKGKITIKINGKTFLRFLMNSPCTHLFLKQIFIAAYQMTKDCLIKKGNYPMFFDIRKLANEYYGGNFIYGNLTFETVLTGDDCNFSCTYLDVMMAPKDQ
ncbi:hypothetical protein evm_006166 [Chilo suppressalis]|nr:hypothetical protein evm_006166 [Chilo suppressalis]